MHVSGTEAGAKPSEQLLHPEFLSRLVAVSSAGPRVCLMQKEGVEEIDISGTIRQFEDVLLGWKDYHKATMHPPKFRALKRREIPAAVRGNTDGSALRRASSSEQVKRERSVDSADSADAPPTKQPTALSASVSSAVGTAPAQPPPPTEPPAQPI